MSENAGQKRTRTFFKTREPVNRVVSDGTATSAKATGRRSLTLKLFVCRAQCDSYQDVSGGRSAFD